MRITTVLENHLGLHVVQYNLEEFNPKLLDPELLKRNNSRPILALIPDRYTDSSVKEILEGYKLRRGEINTKQNLISGQSLGEEIKATCNSHNETTETFYSVIGESGICYCSVKENCYLGDKNLNGNSVTLLPGYAHRVSSKKTTNPDGIFCAIYDDGSFEIKVPLEKGSSGSDARYFIKDKRGMFGQCFEGAINLILMNPGAGERDLYWDHHYPERCIRTGELLRF